MVRDQKIITFLLLQLLSVLSFTPTWRCENTCATYWNRTRTMRAHVCVSKTKKKKNFTCQHKIHKYFADWTACQVHGRLWHDVMSHHVTATHRNREVWKGIPSAPIKENSKRKTLRGGVLCCLLILDTASTWHVKKKKTWKQNLHHETKENR